ncbi:superfamily II DNA/RNA helicase [Ornithinimicrobium humiphilum]|uniref:Superfamily II DNA/RNA helicase n=2 Tax=Ornithinimicrobium humiphilum TaxID=125288 RepID=A0A543KN58_9MICO|nr:superfamily II DNA/RNA helicase [Ornithinimicrobium humiphilum]
MAKSVSAGSTGKKSRHTPAQKKAAREAREKQARAQLKGPRRRPEGRYGESSDRRDDRGGYQRRDDRGGSDRRDDRGGYQRRDERGGYQGREDRGGYQGRSDRGGYQGRNDRSGSDRGGYQGRSDRGGFERRDDRGGYQGRSDRGGYQGRNDRSGSDRGGYQGRSDRGGFERRDDRGGYQGRSDRGGYQGRSDRGGFERRDDRGGYQRRDDRGGYQRRDDRPARPRWADEDRSDYRQERRDREVREERRTGSRNEHTWRTHRDERDGREARRGHHEGRGWEDRRHRGDRFDDRRGGRPERDDAGFVEAEQEREAADAAYQEHLAASAAKETVATVTEDNGFAALGLHEDLVAALARTGITQPFPIQAATIPDALEGKDLLGRGQTGSGKTMAFGLPMLHRLAGRPRAVPHRPRAIILTPTRELAMQIVDALAPLMRAIDKRFLLVAGGMSYTPQLAGLERGVDVLVATPGRLIDLIERSAADLSEVEVTILDEADHMAEMGFVDAIKQVLDLTPTDGQRLLFSATLDHGVDQVAQAYLTDPVTHSTDDVAASVDTMEHHVFLVHPHHKKPITAAIANRPGRTVVFCRTKLGADRVAMQLRDSGVFAAALHGGLNQAQRTRVLDAFKGGTLPVLVATDVAARGIHVDEVSLVLQVDPPADHKDYLHRSGRTARAGEDGVVVTLALPHQKRQVGRLLDAAGVQTDPLPVAPEDVAVIETAGGSVPDAEPIPQSRLDDILRPPRPQGRGGRGRYNDRNGRDGGRGGRGGYGGRGGDRDQRGGPSRRPRRDPDAPARDARPDWRPRG